MREINSWQLLRLASIGFGIIPEWPFNEALSVMVIRGGVALSALRRESRKVSLRDFEICLSLKPGMARQSIY